MPRIPRIHRPRIVWRETVRRIERLEDKQDETERLLDAAFSEAVHQDGEAVGLNGQRARKEMVKDLFDRFAFSVVVETGTHFGATAGYFATEYGVPVYTCEVTPRYFHVASHLLRNLESVRVRQLDSRALLKELAAMPAICAQRTLFYLDAHWFDDLPLAEELDAIARHWTDWVAVVDDFQVPGDHGYGFDDYGGEARLTLEYAAPVLRDHGLPAFFPTQPSGGETGARRGCLVTCADSLMRTLAESSHLRESKLPRG